MVRDYTIDLSSGVTTPSRLDAEADLIKFAFEASNVGYWVWDQKTDHVYLSAASLEMLQLPKDSFNNRVKDIQNLIHPDDFATLKSSLTNHIKDQRFFEIEFRARRQDGSYIWINIDGRPDPNETGKFGRVGGSVVDATAYVGLKQELSREKENLRLIFDNVPARIWLKDGHNTIIRLNEKAASSMKMRVQDVEGANTYNLFPEMAKAYHEADLAVINSGQPLLGIVEKYTPKDGEHGWVSTDKLPFTHPETHKKYVLVIATDITQQKKYETEIL